MPKREKTRVLQKPKFIGRANKALSFKSNYNQIVKINILTAIWCYCSCESCLVKMKRKKGRKESFI